MATTVKKTPDGCTAVTPCLTAKGAAQTIDFHRKASGAEEVLRLPMPDSKIAHAEIRIGGSIVMLHDEAPDWKASGPQTAGATAVSIMLYVNDADAVFKRAVAAAAGCHPRGRGMTVPSAWLPRGASGRRSRRT